MLLSGLGALVLDEKEASIIHHHHKVSLELIQRLLPSTPEVVVMFLAGSLPATGILHARLARNDSQIGTQAHSEQAWPSCASHSI